MSCLFVCNIGVLWPNSWIDQDATWCGGRPRPRPHCVRWGASSPCCTERGTAVFEPDVCIHINCGPCLLWPNSWMDQDATWYRGRPRRRWHCVKLGPSFPWKGAQQPPPIFWPMSVVAKWLDGSGTTCTEVGLGPGDIVLDGAQLPHGKGHSSAPLPTSAHVCCWALLYCSVPTAQGATSWLVLG